MKEIKIKRHSIKLIGIIFSSLILLFLVIWLGFSFFSMKSDNPYVGMFINMEGDILANKVKSDFPKRDGKYLDYKFLITLEQYSADKDSYKITGVPFNYSYYYDKRDDARFEYTLDKSKGNFDFIEAEWNDSLIVTLRYRIDRDWRMFIDYSICTLKKAYSNLFNIDNPCARGNCFIERDLVSWRIESQGKDLDSKTEFINEYDKNLLLRSLLNYFITNDQGYFDSSSFKKQSFQLARPDGSFQFDSIKINQEINTNENLSIFWLLSGVSALYNKDYEEYNDIDLLAYMDNIVSYSTLEAGQSFLDCKISNEIISNLKGCEKEECNNIKEKAFQFCKTSIENQIVSYSDSSDEYTGYAASLSDKIYLFNISSEMLYFNEIVSILGKKEAKYTQSQIESYYKKSETLANSYPEIISKCALYGTADHIATSYNDYSYTQKREDIYNDLPDFGNLCNEYKKDRFCTLSIAERLICSDALQYSKLDISRNILFDIFYNNYFESPGAIRLEASEAIRTSPTFNLNKDNFPRLDEYGYFVSRMENRSADGITIVNYSNMLDSYYFINIFNKLGNE